MLLLPFPVELLGHHQTLVTSLGSQVVAKQRQGEAQMKDSLDLGGLRPLFYWRNKIHIPEGRECTNIDFKETHNMVLNIHL